jgi:4-nitrophenyl phosphatase
VLPEETLAVGDRLETDILGGQRTGCPTVLVLSGVSNAVQAAAWQPPPDLILPNLADLIPVLQLHHPTGQQSPEISGDFPRQKK